MCNVHQETYARPFIATWFIKWPQIGSRPKTKCPSAEKWINTLGIPLNVMFYMQHFTITILSPSQQDTKEYKLSDSIHTKLKIKDSKIILSKNL